MAGMLVSQSSSLRKGRNKTFACEAFCGWCVHQYLSVIHKAGKRMVVLSA